MNEKMAGIHADFDKLVKARIDPVDITRATQQCCSYGIAILEMKPDGTIRVVPEHERTVYKENEAILKMLKDNPRMTAYEALVRVVGLPPLTEEQKLQREQEKKDLLG